MASGISYRVTCSVFNIARSTTFDIVHRCLEATIRLTPRAIKVPEEEELLQVCRGFRLKAGNAAFYMCAGALDGCHIRTLCSPTLHDQYTNRKLFCSIQLQGLVNAKGEFIDVFAGFSGSVHDSGVLRHSSLYRFGTYPPPGWSIIADKGYPCRLHPITIVTPYRNP